MADEVAARLNRRIIRGRTSASGLRIADDFLSLKRLPNKCASLDFPVLEFYDFKCSARVVGDGADAARYAGESGGRADENDGDDGHFRARVLFRDDASAAEKSPARSRDAQKHQDG